uniref:Zgc:194655 n=1 Tax=Sinocyclocheilus grahami TaxID=75366 RepID=A0A672N3H6_SINGR
MIYQLVIIGAKGEKKHVNVANSEEEFRNTTVEELRRKIQLINPDCKSNTQVSYRLFYRHTSLEDHDTLGDHGIRNMDTLFVVVRLPGGGGM